MKLLDYHRLRSDEENSWDPDRLRQEAGADFISAAEPLLPVPGVWSPGNLVRFTREPWFESCVQLCDLYRGATDPQRAWLRSRIDHKIGGRLGLFALRAAILGARDHNRALSRISLVAYAIADLAGRDVRDVLIGVSLLCHCANLAGADVPALFREIALISGSAMRALYEDWGSRYPNVQQIGSMGWKQVDSEQGIGFQA